MASVVLSDPGPVPRESKLWTPEVRPGVVPRARLVPLQRAAELSRLVLVSAPAGYRKSTLVAQWSEVDPRPNGWVRLRHGDNDPVVLLARIAAVLARTGPVDGELLEELLLSRPRIDDVVLPLLAGELSRSATRSSSCWTTCTS
jgi:LuxR family transcriptional regulator, maltose regulon positive regulatory protein